MGHMRRRRILYKLRGQTAALNFPLGPDELSELDAISLEQLLRGFKAASNNSRAG